MKEKTYFLEQIHKTMMGFGNPFVMTKNFNDKLLHIHKSTYIKVSLNDEHLNVHFICQHIPKVSMSFHDFDNVWRLIVNNY
jgi:hypothetical protein